MTAKTVFVGLSGGVDSSLSASLLQQSGYRVVGVYMKNWTADIGSWRCQWQTDYRLAKEVASFLGIEFLVFDFQSEYRQLVVEAMVAAYKAGQTPNPDIDCNRHIKFHLFADACFAAGADMIATGHYARTDGDSIYRPKDRGKDQTYFLYRCPQALLGRILWPLADMTKPDVRQQAAAVGLPTADRPDSQGICFLGTISLADFLKDQVETSPGRLIDADSGAVLGQHPGAIFFTLGQRQGLGLGGRPGSVGRFYVVGKDMATNEVYVSQNIDHDRLWRRRIDLIDCHWFGDWPESGRDYWLRDRHLGQLVGGRLEAAGDLFKLELAEPRRALTPGQSVVVYDHDRVVGGGIISYTPER